MYHRRLTLVAAATSLLALSPALSALQAACPDGGGCVDDDADLVAPVHLLQTAHSLHGGDGAAAAGAPPPKAGGGTRDLALVHVPWNFGHTIEKVGLLGSNASSLAYSRVMQAVSPTPAFWGLDGTAAELTLQQQDSVVRAVMMPGGEQWGMMRPELAATSPDTGCPTYLTPQRYWPKDVQARYFGGRKRFGVLRDPYERLVAIFRGPMTDPSYGGDWGNYQETCDVNGGVKMMMKRYLNTTNKFMGGCVFLPQAEYFEGNDYDIDLPIDNRMFPDSMNDVFKRHGYSDMLITTWDILHVSACNEVWSGDFDAETRELVRQVYSRDFELICKYFGHCDPDENTCLRLIPQMCPKKVVG